MRYRIGSDGVGRPVFPDSARLHVWQARAGFLVPFLIVAFTAALIVGLDWFGLLFIVVKCANCRDAVNRYEASKCFAQCREQGSIFLPRRLQSWDRGPCRPECRDSSAINGCERQRNLAIVGHGASGLVVRSGI